MPEPTTATTVPTRHLTVELPRGAAVRWIGSLIRRTWLPFGITIGGRWLASGLEVLTSSLLAYAIVELGGAREDRLLIPQPFLAWISASSSPLVSTLALAFGVVCAGRIIETLVAWCLTWIHLKINRYLTPEIMEAAIEPATRRLLDPPTVVQRWLLKLDVSYFLFESLATTLGHAGTVVIVLVATFKVNGVAGQVAAGFLALWIAATVPLLIRALRASQRSALAHEVVGRTIRDGTALRAELARPSLRAYWRRRNQPPLNELDEAIESQGIWNAALFGTLDLIARVLPIVAVLAASLAAGKTGSAGAALAVLLYLMRLSTPLGSLAATLPWIQQNLLAVQRVFQLVETDRDRLEVVPPPYPSPRRLELRDWVVSLPDTSRIVYPDFDVTATRILCVVGPSGSGKSSLLDSLAGHLPASGQFLVDGSPLSPTDPRWRETCAFVRQEPELVPGTLHDNLRDFPGWTETGTLANAIVHVFSRRVTGPVGLVTIDDRGISVGQRRAVAVLRALGSDAAVLLLDEPTAGLDDTLIKPIAEAIAEAHRQGRLVLMTAHEHDVKRIGIDSLNIVRLSPHS